MTVFAVIKWLRVFLKAQSCPSDDREVTCSLFEKRFCCPLLTLTLLTLLLTRNSVQVQAGVSLTSSDVKVSEVLEMVTRMVQGDPDLGMQCNAAWMLGHLYLSACSVADSRASGQ